MEYNSMKKFVAHISCLCLLVFGVCDAYATGLTVADSAFNGVDTVNLCSSDFPYVYGDTTFQAGTPSGTYVLRMGTDTVIYLTLNVGQSYQVYDTLQLCQSELPYNYGALVIPATQPVGTSLKMQYLKSVSGCDSVVYVTLVIFPSYEKNTGLTICSSELPYTYGGRVLTTAGNYRIPLQSVNGCDSIINLDLSVNQAYALFDTVRICPSAYPYHYGSKWYAEPGNYQVDALTAKGCDSIVFLTLETYEYPLTFDTLHLCASSLPYKYGPIYILDQGSKDVPFVSSKGCDSIVRVEAVVEPKYRITRYIYVCTNDFPYICGDRIITDSGTYVVNMKSIYGCDSIIDLHVATAEPHSVVIYDTTCQGAGYSNYGFNLPESATWLDRLTIHGRRATVFGCDSNITIFITFTPIYNDTDVMTICETQLPFKRHGRLYTESGDYTIPLKTIHGCDSTIFFRLRTTKAYMVDMTDHFCASNASYKIGDSVFSEAGTYRVVMHTKSGCDSIVTLKLIKDDRAPYYPGEIYTKKDLYEEGKNTYWISAVPNAFYYEWTYTNENWKPIGVSDDYIFALRNMSDGDTGSVSVQAFNACGVSQLSTLHIGSVGIAEMGNRSEARVYPNPTSDQLYVEAEVAAERVEVYDLSGRRLHVQSLSDGRTVLSMSDYSAGCYVLKVMTGDQTLKVLKVVRQ